MIYLKKLSLYFYYTANSFRNIECDLLLDALKVLRKDVRLDNRRKLGGNRLDSAYREVEEVIGPKLYDGSYFTLVSDGCQDEADEGNSEYLKSTIFVQDMPMKIPRLHSSLSTGKISLSDFWKGIPSTLEISAGRMLSCVFHFII
jgi:hypothetical protein